MSSVECVGYFYQVVPKPLLHYCRGILVKLVICVSSGQLKIKIANLMQYATLAYFLPFSNTLSLENMIGNLIVPLTKLLYHIIVNSMSRGDIQNIMQWVWQDKSIYTTQPSSICANIYSAAAEGLEKENILPGHKIT